MNQLIVHVEHQLEEALTVTRAQNVFSVGNVMTIIRNGLVASVVDELAKSCYTGLQWDGE